MTTFQDGKDFFSHILVFSVSFSIRDKFQLWEGLKAQTQGFSDNLGDLYLRATFPVTAEKAKV